MCSGSYPAYFGEGTKLTVLGKISAITLYQSEKTCCLNSQSVFCYCNVHVVLVVLMFSLVFWYLMCLNSGIKILHEL